MSNFDENDDEAITLSASTLAALAEFQNEEKERQEKFEKLYSAAESQFDDLNEDKQLKKIEDFQEDWNLSQFWYSKETSDLLARESLKAAGVDVTNLSAYLESHEEPKRIAIISAPSVYSSILDIIDRIRKQAPEDIMQKVIDGCQKLLDNIYLLEFDSRFNFLAKHFIHYDYNKPILMDKSLKGTFDVAVVDPPFLSHECHTKTAITTRFLLKSQNFKTIVCTGERVSDIVQKVYPGTRVTTFYPMHANGLSNEFRCYSNYECESWKFVE